MISLLDATKLATTKLRTRKVRLIVTLVVAGLLFSVLASASQITRGVFASLADFNREGFGDRFISAAAPLSTGQNPAALPEVVARAEAIQKELINRKTVEAKRLGIPYDVKSEPPVTIQQDEYMGNVKTVEEGTPAGRQALLEYYDKHPEPGMAELKRQASAYQPKAFYQSKSNVYGGKSTLKILENDKESFKPVESNQFGPSEQRGLDSFTSQWGLMSQDLFKPFVLPNASTEIGKDGSIPVVAPYSAIEQLLGMKALPESAKPEDRLDRLRQVRSRAGEVTFEACYRNQASESRVQDTLNQQKEIADNKNNKEFQAPALLYALPKEPCGPVTIASDKRTTTDKLLASKQEQFDKQFNNNPEPAQSKLAFRVIGISPDPPDYTASVVSSLISSIVSSNLSMFGSSWFTPIELEDKQPVIKEYFSDRNLVKGGLGGDTYYVELASAASAKDLMKQEACEPDFGIGTGPPDPNVDPYAKCINDGKYFGYLPFGSNAVALDEVKSGFSKVFTYAAMAVALIAAIIMVGTVGRTIADSRRETAVFRAIGAKKLDIVTIYLIYTFFLSLLIFLFALLVGFGVAQLVHAKYSQELTIQSLVAYNAADLGKVFNLYNFHLPDMARLLGLSLAGGALSACFPLIRNLRRNPIRDMRDEN